MGQILSSTAAGPDNVPASRSPTRPDEWSLEERDAAAVESESIYQSYMSDKHAQAMDAIYNFKSGCKAENVDYADAFLTGDMTAEEYKEVDAARKYLMVFWKDVRKKYYKCTLIADGGDFFSPKKRWLRTGNEYRALVEPLDIANWYKASIHLKGSGHYIDTAQKNEDDTQRPSQYAFLDRLMKEAGGKYVNTLIKAEEYKQKVEAGSLEIHKLDDARAEPPRGFKRLAMTQTDGADKLSLELGIDKSTLPGWKPGVRYEGTPGRFKAPRQKLPEPTYEPDNRSLIPAGEKWSDDAKAPEIEVVYNAVVYKTDKKKYLVVRATIISNVQLAHEAPRHCGYFRESLTFWMHTPGAVEISPGTLPLPSPESEVDMKISEKKGKTVGWGGGAGLQLSAVGPTGTLNLNATQTWTQERGEERGFKSEPVAMAFQTDEGKLAWTWTVKRMADTSLFAKRGVKDKSLIGLSTFARTSSVLEVQGTWSFPKDAERPVTLQAYVGQTLRYDAALQQSWLKGGGFQLKTCVNSPDKSRAESIQIPLKLPGSNSMLTTKARGA